MKIFAVLLVAFLGVEYITAVPCGGGAGAIFDIGSALDPHMATDVDAEIFGNLQKTVSTLIEILSSNAGSTSQVVARTARQLIQVLNLVTGVAGPAARVASSLKLNDVSTLLKSVVKSLTATLGADAVGIVCDAFGKLTGSLDVLIVLVREVVENAHLVDGDVVGEYSAALEESIIDVVSNLCIVTDTIAVILKTAIDVATKAAIKAIAQAVSILSLALYVVVTTCQTVITVAIIAIQTTIETATAAVVTATKTATPIDITQLISSTVNTAVLAVDGTLQATLAVVGQLDTILIGLGNTATGTNNSVTQLASAVETVTSLTTELISSLSEITNFDGRAVGSVFGLFYLITEILNSVFGAVAALTAVLNGVVNTTTGLVGGVTQTATGLLGNILNVGKLGGK